MGLLISQSSFTSCTKSSEVEDVQLFDSIPIAHPLTSTIKETSGIADSRKNKGFLWVHEDSGNPTQLYLIGHNGNLAKTIILKGIANRDWEEMQLSGNELYLADIGDNAKKHPDCRFYIFEEPELNTSEVYVFKTVRFVYEDGPRDAEAFIVDPLTKDIYIITKSDNPSKIYQLSFPYSISSINTAKAIGSLSFTGVVGAALSDNGKEAILKTYIGLQLYTRKEGETILQMFQNPSKKIPYKLEPQGEAVTFSADNNGYFTLSEAGPFNSNVSLYYYKRK